MGVVVDMSIVETFLFNIFSYFYFSTCKNYNIEVTAGLETEKL